MYGFNSHQSGPESAAVYQNYDPYVGTTEDQQPLASTSSLAQSPTYSTHSYANYIPTPEPSAQHNTSQSALSNRQYQPQNQQYPQYSQQQSPPPQTMAPRDSVSGPSRSGQMYHRRGDSLGTVNGGSAPNGPQGSGRTPYGRPASSHGQGNSQGPTVKASSTTSEFTKRKNWSQHIIDEIQDFMHVLSPQGNILFTTVSIQELTGWSPEEVVGRPIADFVHADDVEGFVRDFEACIQSGSDLSLYYRFRMKDERYTIFEVAGHPYFVEEGDKKVCKCVFANGRPYPSKNTAMLDSFLELKMENERLRQELTVMYQEIEGGTFMQPTIGGDAGDFGRHRRPTFVASHSSSSVSTDEGPRNGSVIDPTTGLVQADTLIPSSSNTYGALGIGISNSSRGEGSEKKKKKNLRLDDGEFVCRDCGTVDSPEWRKGPEGPKSLCNACGLRYAKLKSKENKAAKGE